MGMCVGMCVEMLSDIRGTNALAVSATPELQKAFSDQLKDAEANALKLIASGITETTESAGTCYESGSR